MKVIFDTDPGIDDAMALLYLNALPETELLGITTIHGNAPIEVCTRNALFLCDRYDIDVPVYRGPAQGITGTIPEEYPDFVHGADGLGELGQIATTRPLGGMSAAEYLVDAAKCQPGAITLLAVGRLTNLALALEAEPDFQDLVKDVIIMGGTIKSPGNVTPWAEANIIGDPEAASIVFNSRLKLTLVGLDVTSATRMTMRYVETLLPRNSALSTFLVAMNSYYAEFYRTSEGASDFPVHDPSAVAYLDDPSIFDTRVGTLQCVLEGKERGRTLFTQSASGHHRACIGVDSNRLLENYAQRVRLAYSHHDKGTPER